MVALLSDTLPEGHRRGAIAQEKVRQSYLNVFSGRGSKEDADIVLVDLLKFSGYFSYVAVPPDTDAPSSNSLQMSNGARMVAARIMYHLNMPMAQLNELVQAVAAEQAVSSDEGDF